METRRRSAAACVRCERSLVGRSSFVLGGARRCLGCTLRYRPLLRRSALTSLAVGTALVAVNQGTTLAAGELPARLLWQVR